MKILILSDIAPPMIGGGETYVINLGSTLVSRGHEVHWVTSRIAGTIPNENYSGIHIHRIPVLFSKNFMFPGRQTFPFSLLFKRIPFIREIDIIQANTLVAGFTGWRLARKNRKPSLLFCHELYGHLWKIIGSNYIEKAVYPRLEKTIATSPYDWFACPSEYSKQTLINAGTLSNKISVIPHGVNRSLFNSSVDENRFRNKFHLEGLLLFGYLGRLRVKSTAQGKNIPMLIKATRKVVKELPNARLVLGGRGYEELLPHIIKEDVQKYVLYLGEIPYHENPLFMRMCDILVCPALADGFCFMLAEAASCGRPIVATTVGSHHDRVINGKTGLLASPNVEDLSQAIIDLLSDTTKRRQMGEEAEKLCLNHTWEESAKKHEEVYQMLAGSC